MPPSPMPPHTVTSNGVEYDVYKLIECASTIQPKRFAIQDFEDEMLEEACWTDSNNNAISPRDLMRAYVHHKSWSRIEDLHPSWHTHIAKVIDADYSFPILMYEQEIIDGMHRLVKAVSEGQTYIMVRTLEHMPDTARISD